MQHWYVPCLKIQHWYWREGMKGHLAMHTQRTYRHPQTSFPEWFLWKKTPKIVELEKQIKSPQKIQSMYFGRKNKSYFSIATSTIYICMWYPHDICTYKKYIFFFYICVSTHMEKIMIEKQHLFFLPNRDRYRYMVK